MIINMFVLILSNAFHYRSTHLLDDTLCGQSTRTFLDLLELLRSLVVWLRCTLLFSLGRLGVLCHHWGSLGLAAAMQSTSELGNSLVEVLSLDLSNLKLLS